MYRLFSKIGILGICIFVKNISRKNNCDKGLNFGPGWLFTYQIKPLHLWSQIFDLFFSNHREKISVNGYFRCFLQDFDVPV